MSGRSFAGVINAIGGVTVALLALRLQPRAEVLAAVLLFLVASFGVSLDLKRGNLLYFLRTLVLGAIGYFPLLVKVMYGPNSSFSQYESASQGLDIVLIMSAGTAIALLGNEIGLLLGDSQYRASCDRVPSDADDESGEPALSASRAAPALAPTEVALWQAALIIGIPVVIACSVLIAEANGPTVFQAAYAGAVRPLTAGSLPAVGVFSLLMVFLSVLKLRVRHGMILVGGLALLLLVWAMLLRGSRLEVVSAILGFAVLWALVRHGRAVAVRARLVAALSLVAILMLAFGAVRSLDLSLTDASSLRAAVASSLGSSEDSLHFSTVGALSTTYANSVYLVEHNFIPHSWGRSYVEYLPRTPPAAIAAGRPEAYAMRSLEYGLNTGGGYFESGEAYANFGLWGGLAVTSVISAALAWVYSRARMVGSFSSLVLLVGLLSTFVRGTSYQTFAFYRGLTVSLVFLLLYVTVGSVIAGRKDAYAPRHVLGTTVR